MSFDVWHLWKGPTFCANVQKGYPKAEPFYLTFFISFLIEELAEKFVLITIFKEIRAKLNQTECFHRKSF